MATDWDPDLYKRFEAERTRPARELLARVDHSNARFVTDLGCGPGNSTELLRAAFPSAEIVGVDTSEAMLKQAKERVPTCDFQLADIARWKPEKPQDVIYANAALQWLPDHDVVFPRLMQLLTENGILAVQMPDNDEEPTHKLMREVSLEQPWREKLSSASGGEGRMATPQRYYDLLAKEDVQVDIWRTTYFHEMPSVQAIVDWFRATRLRPYHTALNDEEQKEFLERYRRRLEPAYPTRANGNVLLPFPRLFIVARKVLKK